MATMYAFRLCYLMDMIVQLKQGVDYHQIRWGMSTDEMKDGYRI